MPANTYPNAKPNGDAGGVQPDEGVGTEGGPTDEDEAEAFDDVQEQTADDRSKE